MREELTITRSRAGYAPHVAVREPQVRTSRRDRHLPSYQSGGLHLPTGNPADITETSALEVLGADSEHSRIPAPPVTRSIEPAAVMVRRPTPRVVAHPAPAIPIEPRPTAMPVRCPVDTDRHRRAPHMSIRRNVDPSAIRVQFFGAVHI